jgi:hypothetical protein
MEFVPLQYIVKDVKFTKFYEFVPFQYIVKDIKFTNFFGTFTSPNEN